jgi:hypothetical protein
MKTNQNSDLRLQKFERKLDEFENRIKDIGCHDDGCVQELNRLQDKLDELLHSKLEKEDAVIAVNFEKRLDKICEEQNPFNERAESNMMFPNRNSTLSFDEDLDDGLSTDRFFGLNS